ncbi:hypothetical protein COCVIDRAFT_20979 [Bipolaris victoriae FI3]|uniref:Uncharacterized protein n=1 Tax=Bipolaris victoriae (strain FI3) TaxID=930091 RepID=W7DS74_BIPV3|nr:hypothetical protein COCVIDRAFT_20979 [Bipolaris victoriae FI3]
MFRTLPSLLVGPWSNYIAVLLVCHGQSAPTDRRRRSGYGAVMGTVSDILALRSRRFVYSATRRGKHLTETEFEDQLKVAIARTKHNMRLEGALGWIGKATKRGRISGGKTTVWGSVPERFSEFTVFFHLPHEVSPGRMHNWMKIQQSGWVVQEYGREQSESAEEFFIFPFVEWDAPHRGRKFIGPGLLINSGMACVRTERNGVSEEESDRCTEGEDSKETERGECRNGTHFPSHPKTSTKRGRSRCSQKRKVHQEVAKPSSADRSSEALYTRRRSTSSKSEDTIHVKVPAASGERC